MKEITIHLTLAQSNLIFKGLAERPFKQVFELIGQLNAQATHCFAADHHDDSLGSFCFSPAQLRLIVEALGELPFTLVNRLLKSMHQQMSEAMQSDH